MKIFSGILILPALALVLGQAPKVKSADKTLSFEEVLDSVDAYYDKLNSFQARFTQLVVVPALEKEETYRGIIYFKKPDFLRIEYQVPKGQLLVADGQWYWFYMPEPDLPQAMRAPMHDDEDLPIYFLGRMKGKYTGELEGIEEKSGARTFLLKLVPLSPNPYYRDLRAWVDEKSFATKAVQYFDDSGTSKTFNLLDIKKGVAIAPEKFTFIPPPGTQILDAD